MSTPEHPHAFPVYHHRHPRFWRRVRLYIFALLTVASVLLWGAISYVRDQPRRIVKYLLSELPVAHRVSEVKWIDSRTLAVENLAIGQPGHEFFAADQLILQFTWSGLLRQEFVKVQMNDPQLFLTRMSEQLKPSSPGTPNQGIPWLLQTVLIDRGTFWLENFGTDKRLIPIRVGIRHPVELHNIHLNNLGQSSSGEKVETADIANVYLISPLDPIAPVMNLPLTRVQFTYSELWHHQIRNVQFINPVIYLGADLFWFTDEFNRKKTAEAQATPEVANPWIIQHMEVNYGQLAVSAFGQQAVQFPFYFETRANNIHLDQLDHISMQNTLHIVRFDHDYPEYRLKVNNLNGNVIFNMPPSAAVAENIVQTLTVGAISWNQIEVTQVSSTLLFDRTGIFGNLDGQCYGGHLTGNFGISYGAGFPWVANLKTEKVNVTPISRKLAPQYFKLTGKLEGEINVQGQSTVIKKCEALFRLPEPGTMQLDSLDGLLAHLPQDAQKQISQAVAEKLVEALHLYPYDDGQLRINYQETGGAARLQLNGSQGKRNFEINWHPAPEKGN